MKPAPPVIRMFLMLADGFDSVCPLSSGASFQTLFSRKCLESRPEEAVSNQRALVLNSLE